MRLDVKDNAGLYTKMYQIWYHTKPFKRDYKLHYEEKEEYAYLLACFSFFKVLFLRMR